jgi:hypothetical protein
MWVWSDDLASQFPEIRRDAGAKLPLLAIAVGPEADLESVARDMIREYQATGDRPTVDGDLNAATPR